MFRWVKQRGSSSHGENRFDSPLELLKAEIIMISVFLCFHAIVCEAVLAFSPISAPPHSLRNFIPRFIVGDSANRKIEYLLELSHSISGFLTIYAVDGYGTDGGIVECDPGELPLELGDLVAA